jgi:hypothetical protein
VASIVPIREHRKNYTTDQGRLAQACRLLVQMELFDCVCGRFQRDAILDTGAPFSVFPFSRWNGSHLSWTPLGSQMFTPQGQPAPGAPKWLGISCQLRVTQIALVDEMNRSTRSLQVIAKFVRAPLSTRFEKIVILGYSFLMGNSMILTVNPASRASVGNIPNIVGSLTVH